MKIKSINAAESNVYCLAFNTEPKMPPAFLERVRVSWVNDGVLKDYIPFITADRVVKLHSSTPVGLNISQGLASALEKILSDAEKAGPMTSEDEKKFGLTQEKLHEFSRTLGIPVE